MEAHERMWTDESRVVAGMALLRILAGTIEVSAALLMLKFKRVDTAFQINAILGIIGPTILILVSALGIAGLAGRVAPGKIALVATGVLLILLGARK